MATTEIDSLSSLFKDPIVGPLLPKFASSLKNQVKRFDQLIGKEDWKATAQLSHQLKGSSAAYGYSKLSQYFDRLEKLAQTEVIDPMNIDLLMSNIRRLADCISNPKEADLK